MVIASGKLSGKARLRMRSCDDCLSETRRGNSDWVARRDGGGRRVGVGEEKGET